MSFSKTLVINKVTYSATICWTLVIKKIFQTFTIFPLISAGPQISAAPLGVHIKISASL